MGKCNLDRWAILRVVELILVIACLVFKRVTDDEARSLSLYLQKLSREWSLLTNVTWDRVGSSVADATYGGYTVIVFALLIGKIFGELPTKKRVTEWVLLAVGAILFIALGSLALASIDSLPHNLLDNAAILGTLSLVTGALFLLDMGGPKAKKPDSVPLQLVEPIRKNSAKSNGFRETDIRSSNNNINNNENEHDRRVKDITEQVYDIEREVTRSERETQETPRTKTDKRKMRKEMKNNGIKTQNGSVRKIEAVLKESPILQSRSYIHLDPTSKGYKQMRDDDLDVPRRFGIYGKDVDYGADTDETASIPPKIELHTPVWGHIRKEVATKYTIPPAVPPSRGSRKSARSPSSPFDPGYVQYTAQHWGEGEKNGTKTPRHSPTEV